MGNLHLLSGIFLPILFRFVSPSLKPNVNVVHGSVRVKRLHLQEEAIAMGTAGQPFCR